MTTRVSLEQQSKVLCYLTIHAALAARDSSPVRRTAAGLAPANVIKLAVTLRANHGHMLPR